MQCTRSQLSLSKCFCFLLPSIIFATAFLASGAWLWTVSQDSQHWSIAVRLFTSHTVGIGFLDIRTCPTHRLSHSNIKIDSFFCWELLNKEINRICRGDSHALFTSLQARGFFCFGNQLKQLQCRREGAAVSTEANICQRDATAYKVFERNKG